MRASFSMTLPALTFNLDDIVPSNHPILDWKRFAPCKPSFSLDTFQVDLSAADDQDCECCICLCTFDLPPVSSENQQQRQQHAQTTTNQSNDEEQGKQRHELRTGNEQGDCVVRCPGCCKLFHKECIAQWFFTSQNCVCPMCRHFWYEMQIRQACGLEDVDDDNEDDGPPRLSTADAAHGAPLPPLAGSDSDSEGPIAVTVFTANGNASLPPLIDSNSEDDGPSRLINVDELPPLHADSDSDDDVTQPRVDGASASASETVSASQQQQRYNFGSFSFNETDVDLVATQTNVSTSVAYNILVQCRGDIVDAIMLLTL